MSNFLPQEWNPVWSSESLLMGLISFMLDDTEQMFVGAELETRLGRQRLAHMSWSFNTCDGSFRELFPEFCSPQADTSPTSNLEKESRLGTPLEVHNVQGNREDDHAQSSLEYPVCFICGEQGQGPLAQACACRGTLAGVHHFCLETWIQRQERNGAQLRCPTCMQPYKGQMKVPGLLCICALSYGEVI